MVVRRLIVLVITLVGLVMMALPVQAQTTYNTEGQVIGGDELLFACDFGTDFAGGEVEWSTTKKTGEMKSLGTVQMTAVFDADGRAYGGVATAPKKADYFRATWTCEPAPPPPPSSTTTTTYTTLP
jgi:hypothetical protein